MVLTSPMRVEISCIDRGDVDAARTRGEKRATDVIGSAVKVMRIATGEETEEPETDPAKSGAAELGRWGGKARATKISSRRRNEIAKKAAGKRWKLGVR
jgi:hypothetical protein